MSQRRLSVVLVAAVALLLVATSGLVAGRERRMLGFDTMVGLPQALTGSANAIRGINGAGLPWTIGSARGSLSSSGHLEIEVKGLVLAAGSNAGSNPAAAFRSIVSCLDSNGATVNVATGSFPATTGPATAGGGNAQIEADLALPSPCIAPIVFVTNAGLSWFASTGG